MNFILHYCTAQNVSNYPSTMLNNIFNFYTRTSAYELGRDHVPMNKPQKSALPLSTRRKGGRTLMPDAVLGTRLNLSNTLPARHKACYVHWLLTDVANLIDPILDTVIMTGPAKFADLGRAWTWRGSPAQIVMLGHPQIELHSWASLRIVP